MGTHTHAHNYLINFLTSTNPKQISLLQTSSQTDLSTMACTLNPFTMNLHHCSHSPVPSSCVTDGDRLSFVCVIRPSLCWWCKRWKSLSILNVHSNNFKWIPVDGCILLFGAHTQTEPSVSSAFSTQNNEIFIVCFSSRKLNEIFSRKFQSLFAAIRVSIRLTIDVGN